MKFNHRFQVSAPSNIAFVKYWGKFHGQLPCNPSLSMTLDSCRSHLKVDVKVDSTLDFQLDFSFEGESHPKFAQRIEKYLKLVASDLSWIYNCQLKLEASNTFPHSAGIASSASAFAALGSALEKIDSLMAKRDFDVKRASSFARVGSGSAARSIVGAYNIWGKLDSLISSDEYASPFANAHRNFNSVADVVCIVDSGAKLISSTDGHASMEGHPFAEARYQQAKNNLLTLITAMQNGNWKTFGAIIEQEALTLHALMMSATEPYILLRPQSLEIIGKIKKFRTETGIDIYFTIDAGPNIHIIYPKGENDEVIEQFIESELTKYCVGPKFIYDQIGTGVRFE